ncbi:unnamed protein product [Phytophthora fragariaefolia]|uniref:Unnamed protein product n=1 Tax=Phytophthora fragariaefolia TaxID=1490495 RepID=A0A9W6XV53_9STRA|nr:unnamed protein product [Phytophthora fragariaefolia]
MVCLFFAADDHTESGISSRSTSESSSVRLPISQSPSQSSSFASFSSSGSSSRSESSSEFSPVHRSAPSLIRFGSESIMHERIENAVLGSSQLSSPLDSIWE